MLFLLHFLLIFASLLFATTSITLHHDPSKNAILKLCPFTFEDAFEHLDELQLICEQFRENHPFIEYFTQVTSLARLLFAKRLPLMFDQKTDLKAKQFLDIVLDLQWKHLKAIFPDNAAVDLQRRAFDKGLYDLIKPIFDKYWELYNNGNEWNKEHAPEYYSPDKAVWHQKPMPECHIKGAERFLQDWKDRLEVHKSYISELFQIPDNILDAIAFSAKQAQIQLDIMKRNLDMFRDAKSTCQIEIESRFKAAVNIQITIGDYTSVFHDLLKIKSLDGPRRADAITELLVSLSWSLGDSELKLPKEIRHLLDEYEPFSIDWVYAKFRLMSFASAGFYTKVEGSYERHKIFIQTQDSVSFLVMAKLVLALKPFASKFCKAGFPYIIFDRGQDAQYLANIDVGICLKKELSFYRHCTRSRMQIKPVLVTKFFKELLPAAFVKCQKMHGVTIYAPLPEADMKRLLTGSKKKVVRTISSPASNEAVVEFDIVKDVSPTIIVPVELPSVIEEMTPKKVVDDLVPEPTPIVRAPKFKKPLDEATPETKASFEVLFKPHTIEVHYDQDVKDRWEEEYRSELSKYAQLKSLPESTHEDVTASKKCFKLLKSPETSAKASFVAMWSTNDFINLFPHANQVYYENIARNTALRSTQDSTMKFRWIFCPEVVIDVKAFRFLCKVFGLLIGKKDLTFSNFQRAFLALTSGHIAGPSKGNRTVFRFNHQFELDGQICVPPIGGVHPEHLSSRFNHVQVRKFLEHGGAHPYFFEEIWED